MAHRARKAHLTIEFEGERVSGELRDERGAVSAFSGWLDLISLLDSLSLDGAEDHRVPSDGVVAEPTEHERRPADVPGAATSCADA